MGCAGLRWVVMGCGGLWCVAVGCHVAKKLKGGDGDEEEGGGMDGATSYIDHPQRQRQLEMANRGKSLRLQFTVPPGARPGQQIQLDSPAGPQMVIVPAGARVGQTLSVEARPAVAAAAAAGSSAMPPRLPSGRQTQAPQRKKKKKKSSRKPGERVLV